MIRNAATADATAIAGIYNHYIENTTISFEETAVTPQEIGRRIDHVASAGFPWLVMEAAGAVIGYAYAGKWCERSAYRYCAETSVYLHAAETGKGQGRQLYGHLLDLLRESGTHAVIGGIALPNDASVGLHEALGFRNVARFREVGRKFGRWLDVGYWELVL